jgi:HAD superfamily hydrolase (TIGR01509 family)
VLVAERGGTWTADATRAMMGMSSGEWSRYVHDELGSPLSPEEINAWVLAEVQRRYREHLPLIPGAVDAVHRVAARFPLGLASSSNREVIDLVLEDAGIADAFAATVSSEEVGRGKPAPDVYVEAARRIGVAPERCWAVEDSSNGVRSAAAAGMRVIAIPHPGYPLEPDARALAERILDRIDELPAVASLHAA